jgi:hypothetical protein
MKSAQLKKQLFDDLRETLKAQANQRPSMEAADGHPDVSELASFFYGKSNQPATRAHLALCQSCAEEIALYARAESLAADFQPSKKTAAKVPAAAWQLIGDWQDNSFAKPKLQSETVSAAMLTKFARLLASHKDLKAERKAVSKTAPNHVPVIIVNRSGDFRGIEVFEQSQGKSGEITLKPTNQSHRFENKELHALVHQGSKKYDVESFPIERNRVRVGRLANQENAGRLADYFIIED